MNVNTKISYSLRLVISMHASLFTLLFIFQRLQAPDGNLILTVTASLGFVTLVLLIADWVTQKDQTRRFSKLVDTVIGLGWLLAVLMAVLWSLSMGTL